jgi:hypothetical protein
MRRSSTNAQGLTLSLSKGEAVLTVAQNRGNSLSQSVGNSKKIARELKRQACGLVG